MTTFYIMRWNGKRYVTLARFNTRAAAEANLAAYKGARIMEGVRSTVTI